MERLKKDLEHIREDGIDSGALFKRVCGYLKELVSYKDTKLTPEDIKELCTDDIAEVARVLRHMIEDGSIDHLQELLAAEKDGRLVLLPVPIPKVGDTVYELIDQRIIKSVVTEVNPAGISIVARSKDGGSIIFGVYDIGRIVFLTRREAEAALKREEDSV